MLAEDSVAHYEELILRRPVCQIFVLASQQQYHSSLEKPVTFSEALPLRRFLK